MIPDPGTLAPLALACLALLALGIALARARRYGARCSRCTWHARAFTLARAARIADDHGTSSAHHVTLYRRASSRAREDATT